MATSLTDDDQESSGGAPDDRLLADNSGYAESNSNQRSRLLLDIAELFIDATWEIDNEGLLRIDPLNDLHFDMSSIPLLTPYHGGLVEGDNFESLFRLRRAFEHRWVFKDIELTVPGRAGDPRVLLVGGIPFIDEDGQNKGYYGAIADITQRKHAEELARQNEAMSEATRQLETVISAAPTCLLLCHGSQPLITFSNSAASELFGVSDLALKGVSLFDLIADDKDRWYIEATLNADGKVEQFDTLCQGPTGLRRWGSLSIRRIDSPDGLTFLAGIVDITRRKHSEIELREAKDAAESTLEQLRRTQQSLIQAEKMAATSLLVAGVAHEINTPAGIVLTAGTLLSSKTKEVRQFYADKHLRRSDLEKYLESADELLDCIESNITRTCELVQSFKRVAVDQTSRERRSFDLKHYVQEVLVSLGPHLRKTGHTVEIFGPASLKIDGYPGAIAQILTNLILNAIQHAFGEGRVGRITISLELNGDLVCLRCTDDGKGVPPENLGRIFNAFFTTRRGDGGTGLGLHIVYNLATVTLGGTIDVRSTVGEGTTFDVKFPRVAPKSRGDAGDDDDWLGE